MAAKTEKATIPDKVNMFKDYDQVLQRVLAESKREVDNLNQQRELLILKNAQLDDELNRKQGLFEQYKRLEEQKLQDWKNKLQNDEINRLKKLEIAEFDMSRRQTEMARREEVGIKIIQKESKLNNDRIDIEKLRSSVNIIADNAERKMSEAMSKFSQANIAESKANEMLSKANAINDNLVQRENILKEKEIELTNSIKNLEEIKKVVDPKIEEIKLIEKSIDDKKKQLAKQEEDVNKKINEESILVKSLAEERKKIKDRQKQLDQRDEEITRKSILLGVKNE